MAKITITNLDVNEALDADAMKQVRGGGLSEWIGDMQWAFYSYEFNDSFTGTGPVTPMK